MLLTFHVILCFLLVCVVLLQAGKEGGFTTSFGGSSQSLFGSTGAGNFLTKMTSTIAILFFVTSMILTIATTHESTESIVKESVETETIKPEPVEKTESPQEKLPNEQTQ